MSLCCTSSAWPCSRVRWCHWPCSRGAARAANVEEFIRVLPGGYDTMVDDHGARLSGGRRQRLVIARARRTHDYRRLGNTSPFKRRVPTRHPDAGAAQGYGRTDRAARCPLSRRPHRHRRGVHASPLLVFSIARCVTARAASSSPG